MQVLLGNRNTSQKSSGNRTRNMGETRTNVSWVLRWEIKTGIGFDIFRMTGFIVKRFAFTKDPRLGTAIYLGRAV